jgi:hypothetical protein
MRSLLLRLSRQSSRQLLLALWVALLCSYALTAVLPPWISQPLATAVPLVALFGYPLLVVFGLPIEYTTPLARRISLAALAVMVLTCALSADDPSRFPSAAQHPTLRLLGGALALLLFSPFYFATHALGEARRSLGRYKPLDSLGTFLSLMYFPFGGVVFVQRTVREVIERGALNDDGSTPHAGPV